MIPQALRSVSRPAFVVAAGLLVASCGGAGADEAADTTTTTAAPTTTVPTTVSTTTTTVAPPTTTTTIPAEPAPLTGASAETEAPDRPAIAIKIDNHPSARPQIGLSDADLVFDLRAEGVTRFMAVFHSSVPPEVGPVRSSRTSDFDLLRGLDNPLYASSGGNANVMGAVGGLPVFAVTNHSRREYYRHDDRPRPHNLFVDPEVLYDVVGEAAAEVGPPEAWFDYRDDGDVLPDSAAPSTGIEVDFTNSPTVGFTWDPARAGWSRTQDGAEHLDAATGEQLAPENVVVMVTTYGVSSADPSSPEVRSVGSGPLVVLTDGHRVDGTWERVDAAAKPVLVADSGEPIALSPGRTWVLYPEAGQIADLPG